LRRILSGKAPKASPEEGVKKDHGSDFLLLEVFSGCKSFEWKRKSEGGRVIGLGWGSEKKYKIFRSEDKHPPKRKEGGADEKKPKEKKTA